MNRLENILCVLTRRIFETGMIRVLSAGEGMFFMKSII